jgi:hypothetical protein
MLGNSEMELKFTDLGGSDHFRGRYGSWWREVQVLGSSRALGEDRVRQGAWLEMKCLLFMAGSERVSLYYKMQTKPNQLHVAKLQ